MKRKIINILTFLSNIQKPILSALLLGLIPAIIIILFNTSKFDKYVIEQKDRFNRNSKGFCFWYEDVENNGSKKLFRVRNNRKEVNNSHIYIYDENELSYAQVNFKHKLANTKTDVIPLSADVTNDGIKEIFVFTQNNDSLFLNIYDPSKIALILNNRFVTKIGGFNDKLDYNLYWITSKDVNGDNMKEVFFSISAGFALYPRKFFRYDFANDSLISSINTGASLKKASAFTINNKFLILSGSVAHDNVGTDYPYPYKDTTCWVFGFNKNLNFSFKPINFNGIPSSVSTMVQHDKNIYFNNMQGGNKLVAINSKGEIQKTMEFTDAIEHLIPFEHLDKNLIYFSQNLKYIAVDINKWKIVNNHKLNELYNFIFIDEEDIDHDNSYEYFFVDKNEHQVVIFRNQINHPVYFKLPIDESFVHHISAKYENGRTKIILTGEKQFYFLEYFKNPYYFLNYPVWIIIYLLSVLFVYLIQKLQRKQFEKKQEREKRIAELQLQNLKNQLDPHFTFNAMNSIGLHIYEEDKEKAYDQFVRFARLIRSSLLSSDKIFRSLEEELQFTEDYLEFQKERFGDKFDYQTHIDQSLTLDKIRIPKMIIQGYTENSVKHAFQGIDRKGLIEINVKRESDLILIQIRDNGMGRKASAKPKTEDSGRGMTVMQEQIKLLNQYKNKNIQLNIVDLYNNDSSPAGTQVEIRIQI